MRFSLCPWQWDIWQGHQQSVEDLLACIKRLLQCPGETCPVVDAGPLVDVTNEPGEQVTFPFTADDRLVSLAQTVALTDPSGCLAANPDALIPVVLTYDHEATPFDNHRGFLLSTGSGTFTDESASNTFETSGAPGGTSIGIGYAQGESGNVRNTRWVEVTAPASDWLAGVPFTYVGFGGVGGTTETLYSQSIDLAEGALEGICDGC